MQEQVHSFGLVLMYYFLFRASLQYQLEAFIRSSLLIQTSTDQGLLFIEVLVTKTAASLAYHFDCCSFMIVF